MQTHGFSWLTPKRMRALTVAAMCAAGLVATVGVNGSTPPTSQHAQAHSQHAYPQHAP